MLVEAAEQTERLTVPSSGRLWISPACLGDWPAYCGF